MPRLIARLALLFGLRVPSASTLEPTVHRGERELCAGTARLGAPSLPIAKLSADEAYRCFRVRTVAAASDEAFRHYTVRRVIADELEGDR